MALEVQSYIFEKKKIVYYNLKQTKYVIQTWFFHKQIHIFYKKWIEKYV